MDNITNRPLAAPGLISYRYRGPYGWIMVGAVSHTDALSEAQRSLDGGHKHKLDTTRLEVWDGEQYTPVASVSDVYNAL